MTTKQRQDQDERPARAVWLARLPSGRSHTDERHQDRRTKASKLARAHGADIIGEFLISSGEEEHLREHVWGEVLDFLQHLHADLLVVLAPHEIARDLDDYARRINDLDSANERLLLSEPGELLVQHRSSESEAT